MKPNGMIGYRKPISMEEVEKALKLLLKEEGVDNG